MSNTDTIVRQDTYEAFKDNTAGEFRLNRRGEVVPADWIIQLILDGRCFICSPAAMETADKLGDASYSNAVAGLALDVPSGLTVILLEIMLAQAGTVAGADVNVLMTVDDKLRISSGVAEVPRNLLINATEKFTSGCKVYSHEEGTTNLVVATNAEDNSFYSKMMAENVTGGDTQNVLWNAREYPPVIIKGPGALVVYTYPASSTAPSFLWHLMWAEIQSGLT